MEIFPSGLACPRFVSSCLIWLAWPLAGWLVGPFSDLNNLQGRVPTYRTHTARQPIRSVHRQARVCRDEGGICRLLASQVRLSRGPECPAEEESVIRSYDVGDLISRGQSFVAFAACQLAAQKREPS